MRQTITKPKQAASPRQLDRWQLVVLSALEDVREIEVLHGKHVATRSLRRRLAALLVSMQRAERR